MEKKQSKLMKLILYLLGWGTLLTLIYVSVNLRTATAAPGRIAYWELNETSGTSFTDSEAGQHTAACTNCPTPTTGEVSGGQSFDGSNDTITVPANSAFNWSNADSFTVELWMKGNCASASETFIGRGNPANGHWSLGCSASNGARFSLRDGNSSNITLNSTKTLNDGRWHHISASYNGTTGLSTLHVDGSDTITKTQSFSGNFTPTSADITIGQINNSNYFNGSLDEIAIHNIVLPTTDLNTHYYLSRAYNASCDSPVLMMPLGDSITEGHASGVSDDAFKVSYRYDLWQSLNNNNYSVDFVGSLTQGNGVSGFDFNHEGHRGWTSAQIADNVYNEPSSENWLTNTPANVVLLHIGTNALITSPNDVEDILDEIDEYESDNNTSITVILARIINRVPTHSATTTFNNNVQAMAEIRIANGDKIIIVDMEIGAELTYEIEPTGDFWQDDLTPPYLHPYETGYTKMAAVWFDALETFMPQCLQPVITSTAITTAYRAFPYTYFVEATGGPEPTYSLDVPIPTGMSIDPNTGIISWTPPNLNSVNVTVRATNNKGSVTQSFTINVEENNPIYIPMISNQ